MRALRHSRSVFNFAECRAFLCSPTCESTAGRDAALSIATVRGECSYREVAMDLRCIASLLVVYTAYVLHTRPALAVCMKRDLEGVSCNK